MIPEVTILIPVLNRPHRVGPLLESIDRTAGVRATPLFLVTPGDEAELDAIVDEGRAYAVVDWPAGPGDYSRKINYGARITITPWLFTGADDLRFDPAWAVHALDVARATHACVIGTNDLGNSGTMSGNYSTHSLVHRDYVECGTIDEPGLLLHEGYDHNFCDTEFVGTARARGTFAHSPLSVVEHLHPFWHKAVPDETYQKGGALYHRDRRLYDVRRRLWA